MLAWGPSGMLEDSEGRLYPFRWALVPLSRIIPSNDPKTGRPLRFYLPELQGRNREAVASRSQVQKLAAGLDARRLMLASSTPADSAPVVWRGTGERSEAFLVVSGNGRTMAAILAFETESEAWEQYLSAVASRWNMAAKLDELDRDERFLAVRVLESVEGCRVRPGEPLAGMDPEAERLRRSVRGADARHDADRPPRSGLARVGHPSERLSCDPRETEAQKGLALGVRKGYIPRAAGVRPFLERETR